MLELLNKNKMEKNAKYFRSNAVNITRTNQTEVLRYTI
jgi:hypothetical protein